MITRLKRLSGFYRFLPKQLFQFSQQNLIMLHKAILATKIEKIISNSPLNQYSNPKYRSLKKQILDEIDNYDEKSQDSENEKSARFIAKQQLKKYFNEGIWVHNNLCSQNRFIQTQYSCTNLIQNNEQMEMNLDSMSKDEIEQSYFRKLRFCPTYVVTGQIFRAIKESPNFLLLTGQYWVGKTYSFILYRLISEIIYNYKHLNCQKHSQALKSQIDYRIPKVIYFNIDLSKALQDITEEAIEKQLLLQCYEIKNMNLSGGLFSMKEKLQQIYNRLGIIIVLLFDQINQLAAAIAQYQKCKRQYQYQKQLQRKKSKKAKQLKKHNEQQQTDQKKLQQLHNKYQKSQLKYKKYEKMQQIMNKIIQKRHFKRVIYLSSVSIEKHYLDKLMLIGDTKHSVIQEKRISYPLSLKGTIAISDVCQLVANAFMSQYFNQKRDRQQNKSDYLSLINKIKETLFYLMQRQTYIMALPLLINQKILKSDQAKLKKLLKIDKQNKLQEQLIKLMTEIYDASIQNVIKKLNKFIKNPALSKRAQTLKNIIIFKLLMKSKLKFIQMQQNQVNKFEMPINPDQKQNQQINQSDNLNNSNLFNSIDEYPLQYIQLQETKNNLSQIRKNSILDEQLFSIANNNAFVCYVNLNVLMSVLQDNANQLYSSLLASNEQILQHIKGAEGVFIQSVFIQMLKQKGTQLSFSSKQNTSDHNIVFKQFYQKVCSFLPIPKMNQKNYGKYSLLQGFSNHIKKIEENKSLKNGMPVLMLPLLKVHHKRQQQIDKEGIKYAQIDHRNKLMDFLLSLFSLTNLNKQILQLYAFDITISIDQVLQKIWRFILEYMNFINKQKNIIKIKNQDTLVKLHYIVLSPKVIDQDITRYFADKLHSLKTKQNNATQIQKQLKQQQKKKILKISIIKYKYFKALFFRKMEICTRSRQKINKTRQQQHF